MRGLGTNPAGGPEGKVGAYEAWIGGSSPLGPIRGLGTKPGGRASVEDCDEGLASEGWVGGWGESVDEEN